MPVIWWLNRMPSMTSKTNNSNNHSRQHWTKLQVLQARAHFSAPLIWTLITWSHRISISMPYPACLTYQIWRATSRTTTNSSLTISSSAADSWTSRPTTMTTWPSRIKYLGWKASSNTVIVWRRMTIPWLPFNPPNKINNRIIIEERTRHKKWPWRRKSRPSSKCNASSRRKPMLISTHSWWTVRCWKKRPTFSGRSWEPNK